MSKLIRPLYIDLIRQDVLLKPWPPPSVFLFNHRQVNSGHV